MLTWEVLQTPEAKAAAHDGGDGGNLSKGEKARVPRMTRDPAHPGERPPGSQQGVHLSQPLRGKKKKIYIYIYIFTSNVSIVFGVRVSFGLVESWKHEKS